MMPLLITSRRRGFTLIEMMIVIIVIAIMALIVIPRLINAGDRARSATYHANLSEIQSALEQFHADTGVYPAVLNDLYQTTTGGLSSTTTAYANYSGTNFYGPYLKAVVGINATVLLPPNPYITNTTTSTAATDWTYTNPPSGATAGTDYTIVGVMTPPSGF